MAVATKLLRRQAVPVLAGLGQRGQQVVARGGGLRRDQVGQVLAELSGRRQRPLRNALQHRGRPALERGPIRWRHAEQFADHHGRQGQRIVGDQVHPAGQPVQQFGGDVQYERPEQLDPPRREAAGQQSAQPGVVGRAGGE
jgi:hypothetical protein